MTSLQSESKIILRHRTNEYQYYIDNCTIIEEDESVVYNAEDVTIVKDSEEIEHQLLYLSPINEENLHTIDEQWVNGVQEEEYFIDEDLPPLMIHNRSVQNDRKVLGMKSLKKQKKGWYIMHGTENVSKITEESTVNDVFEQHMFYEESMPHSIIPNINRRKRNNEPRNKKQSTDQRKIKKQKKSQKKSTQVKFSNGNLWKRKETKQKSTGIKNKACTKEIIPSIVSSASEIKSVSIAVDSESPEIILEEEEIKSEDKVEQKLVLDEKENEMKTIANENNVKRSENNETFVEEEVENGENQSLMEKKNHIIKDDIVDSNLREKVEKDLETICVTRRIISDRASVKNESDTSDIDLEYELKDDNATSLENVSNELKENQLDIKKNENKEMLDDKYWTTYSDSDSDTISESVSSLESELNIIQGDDDIPMVENVSKNQYQSKLETESNESENELNVDDAEEKSFSSLQVNPASSASSPSDSDSSVDQPPISYVSKNMSQKNVRNQSLEHENKMVDQSLTNKRWLQSPPYSSASDSASDSNTDENTMQSKPIKKQELKANDRDSQNVCQTQLTSNVTGNTSINEDDEKSMYLPMEKETAVGMQIEVNAELEDEKHAFPNNDQTQIEKKMKKVEILIKKPETERKIPFYRKEKSQKPPITPETSSESDSESSENIPVSQSKKNIQNIQSIKNKSKRNRKRISKFWACLKCGLKNKNLTGICNACKTLKPLQTSEWKCKMCTMINNKNSKKCRMCRNKPSIEQKKEWECLYCNFVNPDVNLPICKLCYESKVLPNHKKYLESKNENQEKNEPWIHRKSRNKSKNNNRHKNNSGNGNYGRYRNRNRGRNGNGYGYENNNHNRRRNISSMESSNANNVRYVGRDSYASVAGTENQIHRHPPPPQSTDMHVLSQYYADYYAGYFDDYYRQYWNPNQGN